MQGVLATTVLDYSHDQDPYQNVFTGKTLNPLTPKISLVILITVYQTILIMLVWRIWYWIN